MQAPNPCRKEVRTLVKKDMDPAKFIGWLTLAVCVAALVDPRFRKLCWSFLCNL